MADHIPLLESLAVDADSQRLREQMKVWFLREVAFEDCFAKDLHDQFSQVKADMEKRGQMMLELERLRGRGVEVDCLDRLRLRQKSDAEKHVSLRRMLLEARVETHEGSLLRMAWMIISLSSLNSSLTDFLRSSAFASTSGIGCADNNAHLTLG
ncbi:hypothetical protein Tco_0960418 [Tanacetum coccineum]